MWKLAGIACALIAMTPSAIAENAEECRTMTQQVVQGGQTISKTVLLCYGPNGWQESTTGHDNGAPPLLSTGTAPASPAYTPPPYVPPPPAPPQMTALDHQMDAIVQADSRSWMWWHYDSGSMHSSRVLVRSNHGRTETIYGEYTHDGGSAGWVKVAIVNGQLNCLQFFNENVCRAPGHPPSRDFIGAILKGSGGGGSGSSGGYSGSGSSGSGCDMGCQSDRARAYQDANGPH